MTDKNTAAGLGPISILLTTYKALDYLKLCVTSLREVSSGGVEIVIFAHGSGQPTLDYLKDLEVAMANDPAGHVLRYHFEPQNLGITRAINRAVQMATREYLYLINDDMVFAPGYDTNLLRHMRTGRVLTGTVIEPERPNLGIAAINIKRDFGLYHTDFNLELFKAEAPKLAEDRTEPGINSPYLIERALFNRLGGVDERFYGPLHDPDFFYRIALEGVEMLRVRDSLCYHFSGRSLRFEGDRERVSRSWIEAETAGKLAFLRKWGERPAYRFGGVPQPGVKQPDQKWPLLKRLKIGLRAFGYRRKAARQLRAAGP